MTMSIFDFYNPYQLRQIFLEKHWPEEFRRWIHPEIAYELLDSWLESVDDASTKNRNIYDHRYWRCSW